ncbi:Zinc finger BED domain-containing protein RICESLEEPER 2 [Linum perenne]
MKTATPLYKKISRTTSTTDVFSTYEVFKKKIMEVLKIAQRISLTTDLWKSSQTVEYMVVTCHFVDRNWKLQKRILNFCDLPPPHSGISISDALHKCLVEWDIERKIWTITVDNASNNDVAIRTLKRTLTCMTKLPLGGDIFHVRCCAHILNIMVQFGLKEIEGVIENVRQSVKHIAISESRVNMFREVTKQLRLSGKKLILDCCTRWNSTFHMISVALEDPWYKWLPSEEEWQRVSQVCQFLEVFSDVTNIISGSSYTTGDECMKSMAEKMQEKFDKYWGESALAERSTDFNVIEWWKENRLTYKILSRMATEIMAIPITSVASEAAFSAGGRVIEPSRARLGKKTIQALLCSQDWLKNHYGLTRSSKVSFNFLFT